MAVTKDKIEEIAAELEGSGEAGALLADALRELDSRLKRLEAQRLQAEKVVYIRKEVPTKARKR